MSGDSDRQKGQRLNRVAVQWVLLLALGIIAVAYFVMPVRAAALPAWSAERWATEGGEQVVAVAYGRPPGEEELVPAIAIMCGRSALAALRSRPGRSAGGRLDGTDGHLRVRLWRAAL
jgi:hypothetical protein